MREMSMTVSRIFMASIILFAIVFVTAYLQTIYHFNTYVALGVCLLDTILAAAIITIKPK
jgi:hypothetical protein